MTSVPPVSPLVVLDRKTAEEARDQACAWTCGNSDAARDIDAALAAPPRYIPIPIEDARAIAKWREAGGMLVGNADPRMGASGAIDRLVASLPPEHPPWEPTDEQIHAYCERKGWGHMTSTIHECAVRDLIDAHEVFAAHSVLGDTQ